MQLSSRETVAEGMLALAKAFFCMQMRGKGVKPLPYDPDFWVLGMLKKKERPISEIARRLGRSKSSMTSLIDKLMGEGKVRRVPDRKDRRVIRVAITPRGRLFMGEKKKEIKESVRSNLSALGEAELSRLGASLSEVNGILSQLE